MPLSVLGEECATINNWSDQKLLSKHCRHMFSLYTVTGSHLIASPTLQTLLCPDGCTTNWMKHMQNYSSLRALKLRDCSEFKIRPRHLQHLRYLDLSNNSWIKQLPEEISVLCNLQTLNVSWCENLCRLPRDMKYMASLRHLYTEKCWPLKCLQILDNSVLCRF